MTTSRLISMGIDATQDVSANSRAAGAWSWQLSARCRGEDPSMFFHPDGERGAARRKRRRRALALCAECPVAVECRNHSLNVPEPFGVWGGICEEDRGRLIRRLRRP